MMTDDNGCSFIERARDFATKAHDGQVRKYTGLPYVTHCGNVVALLRGVGIEDEDTLAAAWLHDTIEDCPVTFSNIADAFGPDVAELVLSLTDYAPAAGNRAKRKLMDRERLSRARPEAQSIKVADLIDNTGSIEEHDPTFATTYMREKAALLPLLTRANEQLRSRAAEQNRITKKGAPT